MTIIDFIGEKVELDEYCNTIIWGVDKEDTLQRIVDIKDYEISVRGWGAIQNLFKNKKGSINMKRAEAFHDKLIEFVNTAIDEEFISIYGEKKPLDYFENNTKAAIFVTEAINNKILNDGK